MAEKTPKTQDDPKSNRSRATSNARMARPSVEETVTSNKANDSREFVFKDFASI